MNLLELIQGNVAEALAGGWSGEEAVEGVQVALDENYGFELEALGEAQLTAVNGAIAALVAGEPVPAWADQVLAGLDIEV